VVPLRRRVKAALFLLVGGGIFLGIKSWTPFGPGDSKTLARIGHPLPPLRVQLSGTAVDLRDITSGRRSVIVFYSPSCQTCRAELPSLRPFPESLLLVMVSESGSAEREGLDFGDALLCYDRWGVLTRSFAAAALPTIAFVDENGILRDGLLGSHKPGLLQRKLKEFADRPYQKPEF
jgi:hypothetical protein